MDVHKLEQKARWVRRQVLEMIVGAGKGHIGGSLSCTDLLVALFHGGILRFDAKNPSWHERDRYIHSKGHAPESFYAVLASVGYFPVEELTSYAHPGAVLGPSADTDIPGIEIHGGSLGHGLGIAIGLAISAQMDRRDHLVVVMLGDGESHEGSVWEAAMFAAYHRLNNLIAIVDHNGQMVLDYTKSLDPFDEKWQAFGWDVRVINGHSFEQIFSAFEDVRNRKSEKPLAIIANTVKGKGVSFMEGQLHWHHNVPKGEQVEIARKELTIKCLTRMLT